MRSAILFILIPILVSPALACRTQHAPHVDQAPSTTSSGSTPSPLGAAPSPLGAAPSPLGAASDPPRGTKLGVLTGTLPFVALGKIAGDAKGYANLRITTEGMITAVCQARGCWMEMADEPGRAHVKMHGHSFSIPRNASGRRARVEAAVVAPIAEQGECEREAQKQTQAPLPQLQLDATGVELL